MRRVYLFSWRVPHTWCLFHVLPSSSAWIIVLDARLIWRRFSSPIFQDQFVIRSSFQLSFKIKAKTISIALTNSKPRSRLQSPLSHAQKRRALGRDCSKPRTEPTKIRSNYMYPTPLYYWVWFSFSLLRKWRDFCQPVTQKTALKRILCHKPPPFVVAITIRPLLR